MPNIGKYEIESRIGHGGMGDVYRAFDPTLRRRVAIKVLKVEGDPETLNRFRLEATSAGNLNHRNIVTIYDYGDFEGEPYIVMEYLEGQDLQRTMDSGRKFDLVEITDIMSQVADALENAHQHGVIHRDVKPANIMLLNRGGVKLMDFGIARLAGANTKQTKVGHLVGTVLYMSPEQFHNLELDRRVDVWAYGVIYYQLLAGHHPFQVPDQIVTMYNIANKPAPPVCSMNQEVPEALGQIVDRCLSKDRDQRYSTMEDLRYDVLPVLQDLSRQQAARMVTEAGKLIDSGDWDSAQAAVKRALELDPANRTGNALRKTIADALKKRETGPRLSNLVDTAEKHIGAKQYHKAIEAIDTALKIDPGSEELRKRAAHVRELMEHERRAQELLQAARQELLTEDLTSAYRNVTEALKFDPGRAEAQQLLASVQLEMEKRERQRALSEGLAQVRQLAQSKSYAGAIQLLQQLISSHPGNLEVAQLLREVEAARDFDLRQSQLAEAFSAVKELLRQHRFADAVHRLEALSAEFPGEDGVLEFLRYAREEWRVWQRKEALERIRTSVGQFQNSGRFDEALKLLERSQAEFPGEPELSRLAHAVNAAKTEAERRAALEGVILQAQGKRQTGEITEALRLVDLGLQTHGPDERLLSVRETLESEWRTAQRNQTLQKAILDGRQLAGRQEWDKAVAHFQNVARQFPDEPEPRQLLAEAEGALAHQRQERAEHDALARASAHEQANEREKALAQIETALRLFPQSMALLETKARLEREIAEVKKTKERELKLFEARRKAEEEQRRLAQELQNKAEEHRRQQAAKVEDALAKAYLAIGQGELAKAARMITEAQAADANHPGVARAQSDLEAAQNLASQKIAAPSKPFPVKAVGIGAGAAVVLAAAALIILNRGPEPTIADVSPASANLANPVELAVHGRGAFTAKASDSWISVAPASGSLPATIVVTGKPEGLSSGPHQGSVDISAGPVTKHVAVDLTIAPRQQPPKPEPDKSDQPKPGPQPPDITLNPSSLDIFHKAGTADPPARSVYVDGKGPYQASVRNGEWVSVSPAAGNLPGNLTISIHPGQLPPGSYATQLIVASAATPAVRKFATIHLTVTEAEKPAVKPPEDTPKPPPIKNESIVCPPGGSYLGRLIGDLVWNGTLPPGGKLTIVPGASQQGGGTLVGNPIPKCVAFDVSRLPPGVQASTALNALTLVNTSGAPVSTIAFRWTVR